MRLFAIEGGDASAKSFDVTVLGKNTWYQTFMTRLVVRGKWLMFPGKWCYFFTIYCTVVLPLYKTYRIEVKTISSEVDN